MKAAQALQNGTEETQVPELLEAVRAAATLHLMALFRLMRRGRGEFGFRTGSRKAASALSWDRDEASYRGPTRNVATLYEYWIFLQLHQILDEIPGVLRDRENPKPSENAEPFLDVKGGELVINLKRGQKTCAPFTLTLETGLTLRLHLYYERTFQMQRGATEASSYSRQFKPDYTLAIFPARFPTETTAAAEGKIAYVHFDAKYRAENLKMIFGDLVDGDLDADKQESKATSTYQRGDLLKMHSYNDAVRQTAGSYILYPGSDRETTLNKFHEIVPGVGAFILKPGNPVGREALKHFLRDIFQHQVNQFTQYRHFSDVLHATVRESPGEYRGRSSYRPNASCVWVFVKKEVREWSRQKRLVYCRALAEDGSPVRIQLGNLSGAILCPYKGPRSGPKVSLPWLASILSCEMMPKEVLCGILRREAWPEDQMPTQASAYLLFRLDEPSPETVRNITAFTPANSFQATSGTFGELNSCPKAEA